MQIPSILAILLMLPALLVPGGLGLCMCACPAMSAPVAAHSCCAQPAPAGDAGDLGQPVVVAHCSDCHEFSVPQQNVLQADPGRADWAAAQAYPVAIAPFCSVPAVRPEHVRPQVGCRFLPPPDKLRSLPLLI